jgi:hypothetical protein
LIYRVVSSRDEVAGKEKGTNYLQQGKVEPEIPMLHKYFSLYQHSQISASFLTITYAFPLSLQCCKTKSLVIIIDIGTESLLSHGASPFLYWEEFKILTFYSQDGSELEKATFGFTEKPDDHFGNAISRY